MIGGRATLWCLIEGGVLNSQGGWKNPQNLINRGVGLNVGVGKLP